MKKDGFALDHGVFPGAELAETGADEIFQPFEGALPGCRNPEIGGFARVVRKEFRHIGGRFFYDWIFFQRREGRDLGFFLGELPEGAAVLVVEVPISPFGLTFWGHEDVFFRPKSPVVGFHEEVLLSLGPSSEVVAGDEELGAAVSLDRHVQFFGQGRQRWRCL